MRSAVRGGLGRLYHFRPSGMRQRPNKKMLSPSTTQALLLLPGGRGLLEVVAHHDGCSTHDGDEVVLLDHDCRGSGSACGGGLFHVVSHNPSHGRLATPDAHTRGTGLRGQTGLTCRQNAQEVDRSARLRATNPRHQHIVPVHCNTDGQMGPRKQSAMGMLRPPQTSAVCRLCVGTAKQYSSCTLMAAAVRELQSVQSKGARNTGGLTAA